MFTRNIKRITYALRGIWIALKTDYSYRLQFFGGLIAIGLFAYFARPLSQTEILFLGLAWILILVTELQNTALEKVIDTIHPERHQNIGDSKDMSAGAVLTAGFFLVFVMMLIVLF